MFKIISSIGLSTFQITHHVTDTRPVLPLRTSTSATLSDTASSTGPFFQSDADGGPKLRHVRGGVRELKAQDRSRESRRSNDDNKKLDRIPRDKSRDERSRDKSRDSRIRLRIREKSRDRLTIRNGGDATTFDILREKSSVQEAVPDKLGKSGKGDGREPRKLSKQNTYIFQNGRNAKYQEQQKHDDDIPPPVPEHSLSYRLRQSVDSQDYSTVLDDLSRLRLKKDEEDEECLYAEICDNIYSTTVVSSSSDQDSRSSSFNRPSNRTPGHNWSFGTGSSDDNHYSFTLLRQDVGRSYFGFTSRDGTSNGDGSVTSREGVSSNRDGVTPLRRVTPLRDGVTPLREGVTPLRDGVTPLRDGVTPLRDGVTPLRDGVTPLRDGVTPLRDGVTPLRDGVTPLRDGVTMNSKSNLLNQEEIIPNFRVSRLRSNGHNWGEIVLPSREEIIPTSVNSRLRNFGFSAADIVPSRRFISSARHAYRPPSPTASPC
ncbi:hypothetical protein HAZT_HAZT000143 [Hyalella azteca]|uniref:Uncharacterized protein n=1 Tax=Hyalella azteca TaxID=294128 RepID=A0A6A0HA94_HYAAZ|nr:hypothetical protein HAZT_HAZT000143 [Hyalella azteca]